MGDSVLVRDGIGAAVPAADTRARRTAPEDGKAEAAARPRQLVAAHPELRALMRPAPVTAWFGIGAVALQTGVAVAIADAPWWALLLAAYSVGAVVSLALLVLVHETIHNLVFRRTAANIWLGIFINLPNLFPSATSFRKYHLAHHRHHGDPILDGDIPGEREVEWVGRSPARKALWLFFMWAVQISRTRRMKSVAFADRWLFANVVAAGVFVLALALFAGPGAIAYLFLSSIFGIGLHPLGARWIQEHHQIADGQSTNSYYGPLNRLLFNAGYHHEHHDLAGIPWLHLPRVRRIAPEYYEGLHAHRSWTALLLRFLFDRSMTLDQQRHTA